MAARDTSKAEAKAAKKKAEEQAAKQKAKEKAAKQKAKDEAAKQKAKDKAAKQKAAKQKAEEQAAKQKAKDKAARQKAADKAAKQKAKQKAAKQKAKDRVAEQKVEDATTAQPAEQHVTTTTTQEPAPAVQAEEVAGAEVADAAPARPARRRPARRAAPPPLEQVPAHDRTIRPKGWVAEALGKEDAVERATQRATLAASYTTRDHDVIRGWAQSRGGRPADVAGTGRRGRGGAGVLRIEFPAGPGDDSRLEDVDWSTYFETFDTSDVDFLYQERVRTGEISRFHKLVRTDA